MGRGAPFAGAVWSFPMKIELKHIQYSAALSQETAAYTAEIWIVRRFGVVSQCGPSPLE